MLTAEPGRPLEGTRVNGAQALIRTLTACGVDTCFSNPGTSEMHFVAALDAVPELRGVPCLLRSEGPTFYPATALGTVAVLVPQDWLAVARQLVARRAARRAPRVVPFRRRVR